MINLHRLMLFYHVARCGGIVAALPHVGYGLQQPGLSAQMIQLERDLGTTLFQRRPFVLTDAGQRLYEHLRLFFEPLHQVLDEVCHVSIPRLRIGADDLVLTEILPPTLASLRRAFPHAPFVFHAGSTEQHLAALREGRLDVAILALHRAPPPDLQLKSLLRAPLALLAPSQASYRTADLLRPDFSRPPLVVATENEAVMDTFAGALRARGLLWRPHARVPSLALVPWLVKSLDAVGLTLDLTPPSRHRGLRRLPLPDFPLVEIAVLWRAPTNPLQAALLDALNTTSAESKAA